MVSVSSQIISDDDAIQADAKNLFLGCVPERKEDLARLCRTTHPNSN
jgi:hypothetical protein